VSEHEPQGDLTAQCMRLEQIRFLIRLSKDLRFLGLKQYEHASGRVDEIGREIGGWIRHCRGRETQ